jgi:hypothetical protein
VSIIRSIRVRGKNVEVTAVHRTVFKGRYKAAYAALEESEFAIPDTFHVSSDMKKVFFCDMGLVPAVYTWNGTRWTEVKR